MSSNGVRRATGEPQHTSLPVLPGHWRFQIQRHFTGPFCHSHHHYMISFVLNAMSVSGPQSRGRTVFVPAPRGRTGREWTPRPALFGLPLTPATYTSRDTKPAHTRRGLHESQSPRGTAPSFPLHFPDSGHAVLLQNPTHQAAFRNHTNNLRFEIKNSQKD